MPADDVVLNARQIAGYSPVSQAQPADAILIQRGGLGGPYASISPSAFVGTALSTGGNLSVAGQISAQSIQGGAAQFSNLATQLLSAQTATIRAFNASWGAIAGVPIATSCDIEAVLAKTVWSVNGRRGDVTLSWLDVPGAAPIFSPRFFGTPCAETPAPWSNSSRLATTAFVHRAIVQYLDNFIADHPFVFSFNGRTGDIVLTAADITAANPPYAPFDSPSFTGLPNAPTAAPGTSTGQLATTAFVMNAITESTTGVASFNARTGAVTLQGADITAAGGALTASPTFTGNPQAPTASLGTNTNQIATTAFVMAELAGVITGVTSFNGRTGSVVLTLGDVTSVGGAPLVSPAFSSVPTAPTAAPGTNTVQLATTAFVVANSVSTFNGRTGAVTLSANDISAAGGLVNPSVALTGVPTAPTAAPATSTTQIATTAFVQAALAGISTGVTSFNGRGGAVTLSNADVIAVLPASTTTPLMDGTAAVGIGTTWARADHVHPTDTSRAAASALAAYLPINGSVAMTGPLSGPGFTSTNGVNVSAGTLNVNQGSTFGATANLTNVTFSDSGTPGPGNTFSFGWAAAPTGYGTLFVNLNSSSTPYTVVRSMAVAGTTYSVTLLQSPGAQNSLYVQNDVGSLQWSVTASDGRLKSNLAAPSRDALAIVNGVAVNQCDFQCPGGMVGPEHWDFTLVAEDVSGVLSYAYMPPPANGYSSLHPLHLITVLWKAVQQLSDRLAMLEKPA